MNVSIEDGKGTGRKAFVDQNNNLHVDSISRTQSQQAALTSNAYNVSTGLMTLTTAGESAVSFLSYDGDDPLVVKEIGVSLSTPTGGSGSTIIRIVAGSTTAAGGTIISNADAVDTFANRDIGSVQTIEGAAYKGAEGYTLTGLNNVASTSRSAYDVPVIFDAEVFVLRKGTCIGVFVDPPAGTTSQTVVVFGTIFVETADVTGGEA